MANFIKLVMLLIASNKIFQANGNDCSSRRSCLDCVDPHCGADENCLSCRWCPRDSSCHAHGSHHNICHFDENIADKAHCPPVTITMPTTITTSKPTTYTTTKTTPITTTTPTTTTKPTPQEFNPAEGF